MTNAHDPLYLKVNDVEFYIDLGAERLIAAEKAGQKIAIEIKSFLGASEVTEFHLALGQILNYRLALKQEKLSRILYLAIPLDTYEDFFSVHLSSVCLKPKANFSNSFHPLISVLNNLSVGF